MWNFHTSVDQADLIKGLDVGRQTSVDTKYSAFNYCTDTKIIKNFAAILPWVDIAILAQGFFVKAIHGCHTSSFVISSQKSDAIWVLELEAKEKLESLDRVVASIYKVTHEDIASIRNRPTFRKELQQVMELTMDITTDRDWCTYRLHVTLFYKDLLDFFAENTQVSFG